MRSDNSIIFKEIGMNIAKMYKTIVRSLGIAGMATALMLPVAAFAGDKPNLEPKPQEVKSVDAKLKDSGAKSRLPSISTRRMRRHWRRA